MKKIILIGFIISLPFLSSCKQEEKIITKHYSTYTVQTGSIDIDNSFVGYVESENTVALSTKLGGRITNIYKNIGDKVEKGELLAELDSSEAKVGYSTAGNIASTLQEMKTQTSDMFDSQIIAMQAKIEQIKAGNTGIELGLQDTQNITEAQLNTALSGVEQAKVGLETAKTNLEQTNLVLQTTENQIYKNTISAITNSIILDTNILNFVDVLIGVTDENKDENNSFQDYLSAKNRKYLQYANKEFLVANNLFKEYRVLYEEKIENNSPDNETIKQVAEKGVEVAESIKVLLNSTYYVMNNSIANVQLTQETINNYKSQISAMGKDIEVSLLTVSGDYILGLKGSIENMNTFSAQSQMQLSLLEKQLLLAEKSLETANNTYEQYKAMSEGQLNEVNTKKDITENQLKEALAGLEALKSQKQTSLSEIQSKLSEVYGEKNTAGVMISNGKIISPISGTIINKTNEIGQVVGGGMPILVVADESKLQIKVGIGAEDSKEINIGDNVQIQTEGENKQISGKVKNIYPSKDPITKKNIVEISLEKNNIKIGTMVKVYFQEVEKEEDSIIIPNSAILQNFMLPGVYTMVDSKVVFKNIVIIKQNDYFSVITGLKPGEIIITEGKENIYDGEQLINN